MREKLNSNPLAQVALIGGLLIIGFFLFSTMGKGGEESSESSATPTEATVTVAGTGETGTAVGASPGEAVEAAISSTGATATTGGVALPPVAAEDAPPPPKPVLSAYNSNKTVVLLFVRNGGIDDRMVEGATRGLASLPDVATFVIPAGRIARYASIAEGVAVDRVPALVVVRPKNLKGGIPVASVQYGFVSHESVVQAVVDAGYEGRTLDYHP